MRWAAEALAKGLVFLGTVLQTALVGCALLLLLRVNRGFFDRRYYRASYRARPFRSRFPKLEFAFGGAFALKAPNAWYSQEDDRLDRSAFVPFPPVVRFLLRGGARDTPEDARTRARPEEPTVVLGESPPPAPVEAPPPYDRFAVLWPEIAADLSALKDVAHLLTPTDMIRQRLSATRVGAPASARPAAARRVMERLPERIEHLLLVPWLAAPGGAERVSHRLIAALRDFYPDGGFAVLSPDPRFDVPEAERAGFGVPIVAFNDVDPGLDHGARLEILDRVLIEHRPRVIHNANSLVSWLAFRERGRLYAEDSRLFDNVYSDIRMPDGTPVGFFWQFMPDAVGYLSGIIADNAAVVARAAQAFALTREQRARFHVLGTPVVGLDGRAPGADLRPYRDPGRRHSLWMSRIAIEKRIDVLRAVAARCPDRLFTMYGGSNAGATPVDLSWLDATPNVRLVGRFGRLADLPVDEMDSYIFTSAAEGMPIALLEASMLGLPTVAPAVGGIGAFIDSETGWLVDGPDAVDQYVAALDEIARDPGEAGRRVAAAQRRLVERHSWDSYRRGLAAIPSYLPPGRALHVR